MNNSTNNQQSELEVICNPSRRSFFTQHLGNAADYIGALFREKSEQVQETVSAYHERERKEGMTRRGLLKAAGVLAGMYALNACGLLPKQTDPRDFITDTTKTIAHLALDIERQAGFDVTEKDYLLLDNIIQTAKERIEGLEEYKRVKKGIYSKDDALTILTAIHKVLGDFKFRHKPCLLFSSGMKKDSNGTRYMDCDLHSMIYLSIGEVLGLPLHGVSAPGHLYIRWDENGTRQSLGQSSNKDANTDAVASTNTNIVVEWQANRGYEMDCAKYLQQFNVFAKIDETAVRKGVYLRNLTKENVMGIVYANCADSFLSVRNINKAIKFSDAAIELYPLAPFVFTIRGAARTLRLTTSGYYSKKELYEDALNDLNQALALDPLCAHAYLNRGNLHYGASRYPINTQVQGEKPEKFTKDELEKALGDYDEALLLDSRCLEAVKGRSLVLNALGREKEAQEERMIYQIRRAFENN